MISEKLTRTRTKRRCSESPTQTARNDIAAGSEESSHVRDLLPTSPSQSSPPAATIQPTPADPVQEELNILRRQILELRNTITIAEQERNEILQRDRVLLEEIDRLMLRKLALRQQLHESLHKNEMKLNNVRQQYEQKLIQYRLTLERLTFVVS